MQIQCLQSSRSQVGGSNPDSSVEEDRREILLLKTEQIQLKESVSLQPGGRRGGAVSLCLAGRSSNLNVTGGSCDLPVQGWRVF